MNEPQPPDAIVLSPDAERDLDRALMLLLERGPASVATTVLDAISSTLASLASRLLDGPVSALSSGERCRRFYEHPFWIYYQRAPGELRVLRIYHHARAPL